MNNFMNEKIYIFGLKKYNGKKMLKMDSIMDTKVYHLNLQMP
jgi:hypothetical protein